MSCSLILYEPYVLQWCLCLGINQCYINEFNLKKFNKTGKITKMRSTTKRYET